MPAIPQGGISLYTNLSEQSIGCRSTDLNSCPRSRLLPRNSRLHECDHLPFCLTEMFFLHSLFLFTLPWFAPGILQLPLPRCPAKEDPVDGGERDVRGRRGRQKPCTISDHIAAPCCSSCLTNVTLAG